MHASTHCKGGDVKQSINRCIAYIPDDDGGVYAPSTVEMAIITSCWFVIHRNRYHTLGNGMMISLPLLIIYCHGDISSSHHHLLISLIVL